AAVDLFPIHHAEKVLAAFGRAFGVLPDSSTDASKEQKEFLKQAVSGLAQEGKIICVRLALFAEMMKGKTWTPATLKEVGGTEGVGITFLEETFSAATAPPEHRYHQKAARAVLKALLPESGTDIKGHMRSYADLLNVSGYGNRPRDFDDLIRTLDSEIRLITPTDPEGKEEASVSKAGEKYFQLTHDYLVHSLRDWLTRKEKETRRGRAELLLADRASVWNARPENRQLPTLVQWFQITWLTQKKNWTPIQRQMMWKAGRIHALHSVIAASLLLVLVIGGKEVFGRIEAKSLVDQLVAADIAGVPGIMQKMAAYRRWTDPLLKQEDGKAEADSKQRLQIALALLPVDESKVNYVRDQLLVVIPIQFPVVRDALIPQKDAIIEPLWRVALDSKRQTEQRFQAACALATYASGDQRWKQIAILVAGHLVTLQASDLVAWREALRPAKGQLVESLVGIYRNPSQDQQQRSFATETLADYAADQPQVLADLVMDADEKQFAIIYTKLKERGEDGPPLLQGEVEKPLPDTTEESKEALAKRQAKAAVALLRMNQPSKVWPLLKHSPDPRVRSYLIHGLAPLGADANALVHQLLNVEKDVSIRRALILYLGEFDTKQFPVAERQPLIATLLDLYRNDPDPGLHGAAEWLLRQKGWDQGAKLSESDAQLHVDEKQLEARKTTDKRQWYVNTEGQTFVILNADKPFLMGSPEGEPDRQKHEVPHQQRIGRTFAIASKIVTKAQFRHFQQANPDVGKYDIEQYSRTDDSPQVDVDWYDAARYCNWLSEIEGISKEQWCYEPNDKGKYTAGMKPATDYLNRGGYRLPTEAEWEYACRSCSQTSRCYGLSVNLLPKYAWFQDNSNNRTWPVGRKKPNDYGLFDMLGNAWQRCDNVYEPYTVLEDSGTKTDVRDKVSRVLRGGSFSDPASSVRSACRNGFVPTDRVSSYVSFRPARTFP
ncbi:MAG: SUMF1/EgtB/PvdO family nonheme iron enzyme, partial [Thermoguttaceae bacterium]